MFYKIFSKTKYFPKHSVQSLIQRAIFINGSPFTSWSFNTFNEHIHQSYLQQLSKKLNCSSVHPTHNSSNKYNNNNSSNNINNNTIKKNVQALKETILTSKNKSHLINNRQSTEKVDYQQKQQPPKLSFNVNECINEASVQDILKASQSLPLNKLKFKSVLSPLLNVLPTWLTSNSSSVRDAPFKNKEKMFRARESEAANIVKSRPSIGNINHSNNANKNKHSEQENDNDATKGHKAMNAAANEIKKGNYLPNPLMDGRTTDNSISQPPNDFLNIDRIGNIDIIVMVTKAGSSGWFNERELEQGVKESKMAVIMRAFVQNVFLYHKQKVGLTITTAIATMTSSLDKILLLASFTSDTIFLLMTTKRQHHLQSATKKTSVRVDWSRRFWPDSEYEFFKRPELKSDFFREQRRIPKNFFILKKFYFFMKTFHKIVLFGR
ncbi:hypothetical protein HELRODRAFT_162777 [Helobdella robusta]|uniref:Uncharacterized protein n=1 Tax=Helobdella robusta TaxID=6412 RepID=T1ET46_HELRO|nr:hypothetical protein HELRODRAFT_162777 [Helobdella robusta]ESN99259.1 hypothetical protein HELRODRAFT_162777 [Helobdella robusta]